MMVEKKLYFIENTTEKQINDVYNFNVQVFADSQNFTWTKENIQEELKHGWKLFSVSLEEDIICVLFIKKDGTKLFTKNTPIKINYQGNGFSHHIKEFYEDYAKDQGVITVYNYCPSDNFRMISLNEGHGYEKTGNIIGGDAELVEWSKEVK